MQPNKQKQQGVIKPPVKSKKPSQKPLAGYIAVIRIDNDGITLFPKMPEKPTEHFYALSFDRVYRIDLDEKEVEGSNPRKKIKPFIKREQKKTGWFSKKQSVQTSLNTLFVKEQYHRDLAEIEYVSFHKNIQDARAAKKDDEVNEVYIEARTSDNKRALQKGAGKFGLALNMIKKHAVKIGNALKEPVKEMAKDEINNQLHGGFPDLIGDAKKLIKYTLYLPKNGYSAIQNKAKAIYKEIKGGNYKKAKKCCNDLEKQCGKKCQKKQKGGGKKPGQCGGGCGCKGKCHCKKPGQCGGTFDIHSKVNQEFGKKLHKQFNKKANKLKAEIKTIQKFKAQLKKLPAKDFNAKLKSQKNKSDQQKKNEMIKRQDKKIATKKQAIKDHEQEVYGMFR